MFDLRMIVWIAIPLLALLIGVLFLKQWSIPP